MQLKISTGKKLQQLAVSKFDSAIQGLTRNLQLVVLIQKLVTYSFVETCNSQLFTLFLDTYPVLLLIF